jgi:hypothetical protein
MHMEWLDTVRYAALPTLAVALVFEGVRRLTVRAHRRKAVASLVLGLVLFCLHAAFGYYAHYLQRKVLRLAPGSVTVPELAETWGEDYSPDIRIRNSLLIAKAAYSEYGRLQKHFVEGGRWVLYAPTQEELTDREEMIKQVTAVQYYEQTTEWLPLRWGLIALFSALFGFAAGRVRESAN